MIWLIKFLVLGHIHKWEDVGSGRWKEPSSGEEGPRYVCKCSQCGKYKAFDL